MYSLFTILSLQDLIISVRKGNRVVSYHLYNSNGLSHARFIAQNDWEKEPLTTYDEALSLRLLISVSPPLSIRAISLNVRQSQRVPISSSFWMLSKPYVPEGITVADLCAKRVIGQCS